MKDKLAKEALQRSLLLMKYDTSKTLTENEIKTEKILNEVAPLVVLAWVGGVAAVGGLTAWIASVSGGGTSYNKFKAGIDGCKKGTFKNVKQVLDDSTIKDLASKLDKSIDYSQFIAGTDEELMQEVFGSLKSPQDFCKLEKYYSAAYGDMLDSVDGDIDGGGWDTYVWKPMAQMWTDYAEVAERALQDIKKFSQNCLQANDYVDGVKTVYYQPGTQNPYLYVKDSDGNNYYMDTQGKLYSTDYQYTKVKLYCDGMSVKTKMLNEGNLRRESKNLIKEFTMPPEYKPGFVTPTVTNQPPVPPPAPTPVPQRPQYDPSVANLQQQLISNGFYIGDTGQLGNGVDGILGPKTNAARAAFLNGEKCAEFNKRMGYKNPSTCKGGGGGGKPTPDGEEGAQDGEVESDVDMTPVNPNDF